jgi:uncharacterized protein
MKVLPRFLILVVMLSAPLWLAAQFFDATRLIQVRLPLSALQFLAVLLAALMVTRAEGGSRRALLARGLDFARIPNGGWRAGVFLLMPLTVLLAYTLTVQAGGTIARQATPLLSISVFLLIYGISGYCEQLGWTGIMSDALLPHFGVVKAGLLVGVTWATWHIIPFIQTHNPPVWIVWQCIYTIIYRVMMTKIYVVTNRSVFGSVALHCTYNTAFSLLPYYGSSYQPMYMALATLMAGALVFAWDGWLRRRQLASLQG